MSLAKALKIFRQKWKQRAKCGMDRKYNKLNREFNMLYQNDIEIVYEQNPWMNCYRDLFYKKSKTNTGFYD